MSFVLRSCNCLTVELLYEGFSVLVPLLILANTPQLVSREVVQLPGDLSDVQLVVALDWHLCSRPLSNPKAFLGIRGWDGEELHVGVHRFLGHLLEGLLLLGLP